VLIQVNTDNTIVGHEARVAEVSAIVDGALLRFRSRITRVEVHLSDQNGPRGGGGQEDIRCVLEARLEHHQPVAVSHDAGTIALAVDGAAENLVRVVEKSLAAEGAYRG